MAYISEGKAKICLSKDAFYNPKMAELRDISVLFLNTISTKGKRVLDSTTASGVRAIRYALEAGAKDVTLIDINTKAYQVARSNVRLNRLDFDVKNMSIQEFANTHEGSFEVIDLDPFGSPAPDLFDLMKLCWDGTVLMITATDTAVLCGAHAGACLKIYGSKPLHNEMCKEAGIRILLNYTARIASQFNFGITPLLSISDMHYMRIFIRIEYGATKAINSVKSSGIGTFCRHCYEFRFGNGAAPMISSICQDCGSKLESFGPLWLGKLYDKSVTSKMLKRKDIQILKTIDGEIDVPMFYSVPKITRLLKVGSVSHYKVLEELSKAGARATSTQFCDEGIKTDASPAEVLKAVKKLAVSKE